MASGHFQLTPTKGGPRCIFCEYSERVSREPRNSSLHLFFYIFNFKTNVTIIWLHFWKMYSLNLQLMWLKESLLHNGSVKMDKYYGMF